MSSTLIDSDRRGAVELLRINTGRANLLDRDGLAAIGEAFAAAESRSESQVLLLTGRPGIFCGGFDPGALAADGDALLVATEALLRALLRSRLRVVACVSGHALSVGAALLLAADVRVGAKGPFKVGFPEVGLGQTPSPFVIDLARQRLSRRQFETATLLGRLFAPEEAVQAGFIDWLESARRAAKAASETAESLAALPEAAYLETVARVRGHLFDQT